ncbi:hypothetical protein [Spiroplasma endosymbiont of Othius punctulatus]|uniref:hypothetical protein n=1 Tax=Spiroplasma endosymbiont of Othius punctulatus TaxID=3066289 RepID=UPI0030CE585B
MALPIWALIIIIILTVLGIGLSIWGFFSAFKLNSSSKDAREKNINGVVRSKRITQKNINTFKDVCGVVGFFINTPGDDFFKPIFIDTTTDAQQWVSEINNEITENNTQLSKQINTWLKEKEINLNKINFILIIKTNNIEEAIEQEIELLDELNLNKRMFER